MKVNNATARRAIDAYLKEIGITAKTNGYIEYATFVRKVLETGKHDPFTDRAKAVSYLRDAARKLGPIAIQKATRRPEKPKSAKPKPKNGQSGFYHTVEWKRLRYIVLVRDGSKCVCCGLTPADGAVMNVDHIKPVWKYPELMRDLSNLRVLCASCNWGKGGLDEIDWKQY